MADDEIRLETSMDGELEAALARLEQRLAGVEEKLGDVRREGKRAGDGVESGMDSAARASGRAGRAAGRAVPPIRKAGNEAAKAGAKARAGAVGVDKFADSMDKAARKAGGLGGILSAYKWAGIAAGIFAIAGGLSALAAGAGIAVGGLSPMVAVLAGIPTLLLAVKLSMLAVKLATAQLEPTVTRIKNQFTELGPVIARGGLASGLDYFANSLTRLASVTGRGLAGLGAEIGLAARNTGNLVKSRPFLDQVTAIFAGLRPIVRAIAGGLLALGQTLLNVVQGSLPMVQQMVDAFRDAGESLANWTRETLANGTMTAWLMKGYTVFTRTVGVLADFLVGMFNIFRIGAGHADTMGASIESLAYKFRLWTESAGGQARINQYFVDSLPALHEMGRLLGLAAGGLARLGANQNVAPLLAQINNELAPAIGSLVTGLSSQGGLGPAIISATAALVQLLASLDFSALVVFADAVAVVARAIIWIGENVPGGSTAISLLLGSFLGFKLLGPVFALVASGAKAFAWIKGAAMLTGELTIMQKYLGGIVLPMLRTAAMFLSGALVTAINAVGLALKAAFVTSPIGWIILAIIALVAGIVWLWNNCEWFRDAVIKVWEWIKNAALVAWDWIKNAAVTVFRALVDAALWVRDRAVAIWDALVTAWKTVVNAISTAWQAVVDFIVTAAMWIWDHGLKQVINIIVTAFKVNFAIIKFIVQTIVYIIVGIITLIAIAAEWVWKQIAAGATWLWENVIRPVFDFFKRGWDALMYYLGVGWDWVSGRISAGWNAIKARFQEIAAALTAGWNALTGALSAAWNWVTGNISAGWNYLWTTYLSPGIELLKAGWAVLTGILSAGWDWVTGKISGAWNWVTGKIQEGVDFIQRGWTAFTSIMGTLFDPIGERINSIFEGIGKVATRVADTVKGAWDAVINALKTVWNLIANAWNGIPSITVPDWVPGIGGDTFSLPKLPTLYHGGPTPGGPALVGEHGPEALVRGGRVVGTLGARGPEIVPNLPRGGYVVPNLRTLAAGMARPIPAPVAAAVARSAPAYATAGASHDAGLATAVRELATAVRTQPPPLSVNGGEETRKAVREALNDYRREQDARGRYDYVAGRG